MTTSITKTFTFDAAHRLMNHESKCRNIHGHTWRVDVTLEAMVLDDVGRVIDFAEVKKLLSGWVNEHLDHNVILNKKDEELIKAVTPWANNCQPYIVSFNPTSECMVEHLFDVFHNLLTEKYGNEKSEAVGGVPRRVKLTEVKLWETPTSFATASHNFSNLS